MSFFDFRNELEANAKLYANQYEVWARDKDGNRMIGDENEPNIDKKTINQNQRGNGDERDAFRHTFTTLELKR
jgi:hypothetical protein